MVSLCTGSVKCSSGVQALDVAVDALSRDFFLQKKKAKRRRSQGKKAAQVEQTPELLEESWQAVSQELTAAGFQVSSAPSGRWICSA